MGKTIQFSNLSSLVDKVKVYVVNSGENLGDDDELPIPAGSETELIDIIVQFFFTILIHFLNQLNSVIIESLNRFNIFIFFFQLYFIELFLVILFQKPLWLCFINKAHYCKALKSIQIFGISVI